MNNDKLITKLNEIKVLADECLVALSSHLSKPKSSGTKKTVKKDTDFDNYVLLIVNKIKNCGENEKIEKEILDKISIPGRVLLPFYICYKYFPQQGLTTGDVSKITSELRVGIKTPNVSKAITDSLQKYLEGDSTRMRGKAVVYKLNRKGAKYFESLLNADEKK